MTTSLKQAPAERKLMKDTRGPTTHWSIGQAWRDSLYVFLGWPLHLVSFLMVVVLLPLGLGLAPFGIGIPILMAGLAVAYGAAHLETRFQSELLHRPVPVTGSTLQRPSVRGVLDAFRQPERVGEIALALLAWFPATLVWSVAFSWAVSTVAFLLAPVWGSMLGHDYSGLGSLLHVPGGGVAKAAVDVMAGLLLVVLFPWLMRILALLQAAICTFLLDGLTRPLRAVTQEREHRARLTATQEAEAAALRRLERNIHDGPQQRLVRLQLDIARAERSADDPVKTRDILKGAREHAQDALDELRATSRGIAPQVLLEHGLQRAVEEVAGRCPVPMRVEVDLPRLPAACETALYYVVSEAVANALKHSGAHEICVAGVMDGVVASIAVRDDGRGGAQLAKGSGLVGLEQRLAAVGGRLRVESPDGGPTMVEGRVPCESS